MKVSDFTLAPALALVLLALALALAMAAAALNFPPMPGQAFGARLFSDIVAAGFAVCALVLIMRAVETKTIAISIVRPEW